MDLLPPELVIIVAANLDVKSLARLQCCAKRYAMICNESLLWKPHMINLYQQAQINWTEVNRHQRQQTAGYNCWRKEYLDQKQVDRHVSQYENILGYGKRARFQLFKMMSESNDLKAFHWLTCIKHIAAVQELKKIAAFSSPPSDSYSGSQFDIISFMVQLDAFYWDQVDSPTTEIFSSLESKLRIPFSQAESGESGNIEAHRQDHNNGYDPELIIRQMCNELVRLKILPAPGLAPQNHIKNEEFCCVGQGARHFLSAVLSDNCPGSDLVLSCIFCHIAGKYKNIQAYPCFDQDQVKVVVSITNACGATTNFMIDMFHCHTMSPVHAAPPPIGIGNIIAILSSASQELNMPITPHPAVQPRYLGMESALAVLRETSIASVDVFQQSFPWAYALNDLITNDCIENYKELNMNDLQVEMFTPTIQPCFYRARRPSRFL